MARGRKQRDRRPDAPAPAPASGEVLEPGTATATEPRWLVLLAGLGLTALFLAVSITPLTNNDIWLHMANGRWILTHGSVPLTDPYSFSAEGARFYAHEWLAGIFFHLTHLVGGVTGLILLKTLLGGVAVGGGGWLARTLGARWTSVIGCGTVVLVIVNARFLERPEMFSYALTVVYLWVAALEYRRLLGDTRTATPGEMLSPGRLLRSSLLWWLVPIQWVWVQLHGYFLTGIALLGLFLTAAWVERLRDVRAAATESPPAGAGVRARRLPRRSPTPGEMLRSVPTLRLLSGSVAGVAAILVGLLNPNGYEIYTFPFELAGSIFTETIFEWKPTFMTSAITRSSMFVAFCLWLGLLVASCLDMPAFLRRQTPWRLLSGGGLLALLIVRTGLPGSPAAGAPPASTWLWTPGELLLSLTRSPAVATAIDTMLAPLRLVHDAGGEIFTLVWLGLAAWVALRWRQPARAALPVLAIAVGFILFDAQRVFDAGLSRGGGFSRGLYGIMPAGVREVGTAAVFFLLLTAVPALIAVAWRRQRPLWQVLVTGFFLYMAVKQNRNIANFALVTFPFVAAGLSRTTAALPAPPTDGSRRRFPAPGLAALAAALVALCALTLAAGWPYTSRVVKHAGLGIGPRVPVGAVKYIAASGIQGRAFNDYSYGAYLIHELYPGTRVFMDSRNDVYGPALYKTYLDTLDRPQVTDRVFASYDFDYALVDFRFFPARSPDRAVLDYLHQRPEWTLVYFDHASLLFLRNRPEHAAIIARDGYRVIDPVRYRPGVVASLPAEDLGRWEVESRRALSQAPGSTPARLIRIDVLSATRREKEAMTVVEEVLADEPTSLVALVAGARISRRLGAWPRARELYERALGLRPDLEEIQRELDALDGGQP